MNPSSILSVVLVIFVFSGTVCGQVTVKVRGANTLEKIIKGQQAAIEARAGVKLEVIGNGAGRGLEDLATGTGDIAMIGSPFSVLAEILNEKKPGSIKPDQFQYEQLFSMPAVAITNPANTVASLTEDQLRGLLTGAIKNWKDVGGADVPVVVVISVPSSGVTASIQATLLKGAKFAPESRIMQTAPDIARVVAQLPGAVAVVSSKNAEASVKILKTDFPMDVPFGLVVNAKAKDPIPAVVAAIKELAKP